MRDIAIERDGEGAAVRLWIGRDTVAAVSYECKRPSCKRSVPPQRQRRGEERVYCSDSCRRKHWDEQHPRVRVPEGAQARLDFTPAASEQAHALRGRESKAQKILALLRRGPANSFDLLRVGGARYGARIFELRQQGHRITTEEHADYAVYRLEEGE